MIDYNDPKYNKYCYMPKEGESATFDIDVIEEVKTDDPKSKFAFKVKENVDIPGIGITEVEKSLGYYIRAKLKDGRELSVTSMGAFSKTFKAHKIMDGEKVKIDHLGRGEWKVTRV
jgi:hypothetical protein